MLSEIIMTNIEEFREEAHRLVDWIAEYFENISNYPVKSSVQPGEISGHIPYRPPVEAESFNIIFNDFKNIILPGITHWQSPKFFAYFPANNSFPSILGEMLTSALGAQCMKWETSPAATELEAKVMDWLRQMTGLPGNFQGVIQDTASTATLCALLTARERASGFGINQHGFANQPRYRVYCSSEAHSSVDKAVRIAGIGHENLIKIPVDNEFRMNTNELHNNIKADKKKGYFPLCVVVALGTTGSTAVDPLDEIVAICREYNIWIHIDAAFAGSALLLPEYRWMIKGVEHADSLVFNPHKWLFTNFDCSAYFVKDPETLINTFKLVPEYLKTQIKAEVNDYSNWGIQLGRRFRALKLWFVIRSFGVRGLQDKLRFHIQLAEELEKKLVSTGNFEMLAPRLFNLLCFRYKPEAGMSDDILNQLNETLLHELNKTGKLYMSHTRLNGRYALRISVAQTNTDAVHAEEAYNLIIQKAKEIFYNT